VAEYQKLIINQQQAVHSVVKISKISTNFGSSRKFNKPLVHGDFIGKKLGLYKAPKIIAE